jgi:hypothetical protein
MSRPELHIGKHYQVNPILFMLNIGCLKITQQQILLLKPEGMFEIETGLKIPLRVARPQQ